MEIKNHFLTSWRKYFNQAELPIVFYYNQKAGQAEKVKPGTGARCVMGAVAEVRKGRSLCLEADSIGCPGGRKYLGFTDSIMPNFEYFISCGIPGKLEGERYKKTPEIVRELVKNWPTFKAPAPLVILKRWNNLTQDDTPEVAIFFAQNDVLAGLFTLCNFDQSIAEGVFAPMSSGCGSIFSYPYMERNAPQPRGVIGMFDPSARPFVAKDTLSFAVPVTKLVSMLNDMDESFLTTKTWQSIQKRID
jgi:hypothetical protein